MKKKIADMKSVKISLSIVLLSLVIILSSCKKDHPVLDPPGSKLEGINATWSLTEVVQVDVASIQQKKLNVSTAFVGSTPLVMTFNSSDFTYTVTKGSGPNYFGDGGSWAFDDNEYPTQITLTPNSGAPKVLPMLHTIRPVDTYLNFMYSRTCANDQDPYIAYEFKFVRSN